MRDGDRSVHSVRTPCKATEARNHARAMMYWTQSETILCAPLVLLLAIGTCAQLVRDSDRRPVVLVAIAICSTLALLVTASLTLRDFRSDAVQAHGTLGDPPLTR